MRMAVVLRLWAAEWNPKRTDEVPYQEVRRIVISTLQWIMNIPQCVLFFSKGMISSIYFPAKRKNQIELSTLDRLTDHLWQPAAAGSFANHWIILRVIPLSIIHQWRLTNACVAKVQLSTLVLAIVRVPGLAFYTAVRKRRHPNFNFSQSFIRIKWFLDSLCLSCRLLR